MFVILRGDNSHAKLVKTLRIRPHITGVDGAIPCKGRWSSKGVRGNVSQERGCTGTGNVGD